MKILNKLLILVTGLLLSGCVTTTTKGQEFPRMYGELRPASILMLPPINKTTAADATELYAATTPVPFTQHGYYFLPPAVVFDLLKQDGIYDTESILTTPPQVIGKKFGVDALLFVEITHWNTQYYIVGGTVSVGVNLKLVSSVTGETIWQRYSLLVTDTSGGNNSGGGLAGLLIKAVAAAIQTASTDYVPIARQNNQIALMALPYGKRHQRYNQDQADAFQPVERPAANPPTTNEADKAAQ